MYIIVPYKSEHLRIQKPLHMLNEIIDDIKSFKNVFHIDYCQYATKIKLSLCFSLINDLFVMTFFCLSVRDSQFVT